MRGRVGRHVYRQQHGQTIVLPHTSPKGDPSDAQTDRRSQFRLAQSEAAEILADPLKREHYRELAAACKCPPNALLISNYFTPPVIELIDLSQLAAPEAAVIRVVASDPIEVVSVQVAVRTVDG